jgi:hypothetical protein
MAKQTAKNKIVVAAVAPVAAVTSKSNKGKKGNPNSKGKITTSLLVGSDPTVKTPEEKAAVKTAATLLKDENTKINQAKREEARIKGLAMNVFLKHHQGKAGETFEVFNFISAFQNYCVLRGDMNPEEVSWNVLKSDEQAFLLSEQFYQVLKKFDGMSSSELEEMAIRHNHERHQRVILANVTPPAQFRKVIQIAINLSRPKETPKPVRKTKVAQKVSLPVAKPKLRA